MDMNLVLAIAHHLAVFSLVAIFAAEFTLLRPGLTRRGVEQLAKVDLAYGAMAGIVIIVGIIRVIWGGAGWQYYVSNHAFWGKMAAFLIMGLLTVPPTIAVRQWANTCRANESFVPPEEAVRKQRRFVHMQAAVLILIPAFAAAMARGYGIS